MPFTMKSLVILSFCICLAYGDSSTSQEVKPKTVTKTINAIPIIQKSQLYYQPIHYQHQPSQHQIQSQQLIPVQIIPKPYYVPHQQPAMIIIAQPALLPSHVYSSATQQLLNYFHSNPQAKYQLLHGNYQQPQSQAQHQVIQQVSPAQTIGSYQFLPAPSHYHALQAAQHHYQPVHFQSAAPVQYQTAQIVQPNHILNQLPNHYTTNHATQAASTSASTSAGSTSSSSQSQGQPVQLTQLAHLAQLAAQHYASSPYKQTPAIVTGFENFTPEQQAQIKSQLSNHLGSTINLGSTSGASNQYSSKYVSTQASASNSDDFVPSQQLKTSTDDAASNSQEISKTQYTKG